MAAMIKLTFCLRRRPDLSVEEFQRYWREVHAPLVAARADVLNIRRYVQVHTAAEPGLHEAFRRRNDGAPEPYDGVAELWFDDLAAFGRDTPEARQASAELRADEANFIDLPNSPMWVGVEHPIVSDTPAGS
jgi:uncharacterized protein (TIGR02118 family)